MTISKRSRAKSKYGNKKVVIDGITFDSTAEGGFYRLLKADPEVADFKCHPTCEVLPKLKKRGKTIRAATYTPDFWVLYLDGREEWVEVKGARGIISEASALRMKLFEHAYPDRRLRLWTPTGGYLS